MILCPYCDKNFKDRKSFSNHLTRTHNNNFKDNVEKELILTYTLFGKNLVETTIKDYIEEKYCIYSLPIDISKLLMLMKLKRNSKEERSTDRYKQTYLNGIQKKYGNNVTNISQVQEIKNKKKNTIINNFGSYEVYQEYRLIHKLNGYLNYLGTDKHKNVVIKAQKTCLERYGHKNFGCGKDALLKSNKTRKKTIDGWSYEERLKRTTFAREKVNHRGGYSSKLEKRIQNILIDLKIKCEFNKQLWHYNWDIVIGKIIIEVQGVMWHAKKDRYKSTDLIMGKILAQDIWNKDAKKQAKAISEGYTVIEIWEDEISNLSDKELVNLIIERLDGNGYKILY